MSGRRGGIETARYHWAQLMEGMKASPKEFYAAIAAAVERREIPNCKLSMVHWPEGGLFSAKRLYLRASRGDDLVDICGAPFGTAFFASSWLCTPPPSILLAIMLFVGGIVGGWHLLQSLLWLNPIQTFTLHPEYREQIIVLCVLLSLDLLFTLLIFLFWIIRPLFFPPRLTFYRYDTAQMFYSAVHEAVIEVIQGLRSAQGLRLLTEDETKPIMRGFGR